MIRTVAICAAASVVASMFALLALSAPPITQAATTSVSVQDVADIAIGGVFSPVSITISAGDTVQWNWTGSSQHSVTADDSSFDSGFHTGPAATFSRQFDTPGTFAYFCQIHGGPGGNGMSGTIVVQAVATSTPSPTTTPLAATDTPAATSTLASSTNTPAATTTPIVTNTPATATAAIAGTPVIAAAVADASPSTRVAAVAGTQLPRTGEGAGRPDALGQLPSALLAGAGVVAIAGAIAMKRRI